VTRALKRHDAIRAGLLALVDIDWVHREAPSHILYEGRCRKTAYTGERRDRAVPANFHSHSLTRLRSAVSRRTLAHPSAPEKSKGPKGLGMKPFKVLTIDGGGIKGLYSATLLGLFEKDLRRRAGDDARIVDYTDLICGTSTGGLIALALSLRIPAESICEFYELRGPRIFQRSQGLIARLRQALFRGKFSDRPLRSALEEILQDHTMGDSHCLLCIPTYDFTHGTYEVFKFDHGEGQLSRHNALPMVDVALATSAAPTFFPLATIPMEHQTQYVDGGVWANNPSLVGLTEALWHFVGPGKAFDHMTLLSVSSLNFGSGKPPLLKRHRSFLQWAPDLFDLGLIAQSEFTDLFLDLLQRQGSLPITYSRIPSATISAEQTPYIRLDLASRESFALMKQFATEMYHAHRQDPAVKAFFTEPKTYRTHN
jgi:patatin-like phospholipase